MKAIVIEGAGDDSRLQWTDVPDPQPGPDDVLLEVRAAGLNRADLLQRTGRYAPPAGESEILGLEVSGVVVARGDNVENVAVGDEACALLPGGGYAELARVPAAMLMPVPGSLSLEEAAGIPEVFLTAYSALFNEGRLRTGEVVLVHAGASGVGTAAIQLAKRAGCQVVTTAGSAEKVLACRRLGADLAVNYREEDFAELIRDFAAGRGVDVVIDFVGKDYFERNLASLAVGGRMVHVATLSGSEVSLDIRALMGKRLTLVGTTLRSRPLQEKVALRDDFLAHFGADLDEGLIRPVVDRVFPIQEAEEAHRYMRENRNIGKILLSVK